MIRDTCVNIIAQRLGMRTDLDDAILNEMQLVQEVVLEGTGAFLPWFLESTYSAQVTVLDSTDITLPTDFLAEIEGKPPALYVVDGTDQQWTDLHKDDLNVLLAKYPAAGTPAEYVITVSHLRIFPRCDAVYNIKFAYYAKDALDGDENLWLKHAPDLMIAETGAVMAGKYLQNPEMETQFKNDAQNARTRLYTKHEAMQHTNRRYGMGED